MYTKGYGSESTEMALITKEVLQLTYGTTKRTENSIKGQAVFTSMKPLHNVPTIQMRRKIFRYLLEAEQIGNFWSTGATTRNHLPVSCKNPELLWVFVR